MNTNYDGRMYRSSVVHSKYTRSTGARTHSIRMLRATSHLDVYNRYSMLHRQHNGLYQDCQTDCMHQKPPKRFHKRSRPQLQTEVMRSLHAIPSETALYACTTGCADHGGSGAITSSGMVAMSSFIMIHTCAIRLDMLLCRCSEGSRRWTVASKYSLL